MPFIPIPALVDWTPGDITEGDLEEYAQRRVGETSRGGVEGRGVVVQRVDNKSKHQMAGHYVFVLFPPGGDIPQCGAEFRSRFYVLKRLVADLWCVDQHGLTLQLLHRPRIEHKKTATYGPSLAHEFLGIAEPASFERPDRETRAAVLSSLCMVMTFGHESLLMIPRSKARRSLSSPSSSSSSPFTTPLLVSSLDSPAIEDNTRTTPRRCRKATTIRDHA